ncbi:MAG: hypothetical protein KatS3mg082_2038 [Nitrospiraceae bacterium]|nr:MAG: hypothetical protein KatS3mg082_2038 [Nitrospiraceae bacterium]
MWLSVGGLFLLIGVSIWIDRASVSNRLEKEGRTVEGIVLAKEIRRSSAKRGSSSSPSYYVAFRFVPLQGELVRGETQVSKDVWDTLEERGPIRVTYLPDQPDTYRVADRSGEDIVLPLVFSALGGILTVLGGFVVFNALGKRARDNELRRSGVLVEATVTDIVPAFIRINGVTQFKLRYRFQDAQGKTREGSCTMSPEEAGKWLPGHTGKVRYDMRKPRVSIWTGRE